MILARFILFRAVHLGPVDVVVTFDRRSADRTFSTGLSSSQGICRTYLRHTVATEADVAAGLKDNFAGVREADGAAVRRLLLGRRSAQLVAKLGVLLARLLRGLEEEEGGQCGQKKPKKFENSSNKMAGTSALSGRSSSGGSGSRRRR